MDKLAVTDKYVARLLMVSFFLPQQVAAAIPIAASVYFIVRTIRTGGSLFKSNYLKAIGLGSSFLMLLIGVLFVHHEYLARAWMVCETRVSMLLLPLVFAGIAPSFTRLIWKERMFFVYGCIISCTVANAVFGLHYLDGSVTLSHVAYRGGFDDLTGIHPTYMSMYICFALCLVLFSGEGNGRMGNILKYGMVYLLLMFLLCLFAKTPVIAMVLIFIHYGWQRRRQLLQYKGVLAGALVAIAAVYLFVPFFRQRAGELSGIFSKSHDTGSFTDNSVAMRRQIWDVDMSMLHRYWTTGVGPGRLMVLLDQHYFFRSLYYGVVVGHFDPHNEYLFWWLTLGVVGFATFILVLGAHFVKALQTKNHQYLYLLVILCTTFFTETVLSAQLGVLLFTIFSSMLYFMPQDAVKGEL